MPRSKPSLTLSPNSENRWSGGWRARDAHKESRCVVASSGDRRRASGSRAWHGRSGSEPPHGAPVAGTVRQRGLESLWKIRRRAGVANRPMARTRCKPCLLPTLQTKPKAARIGLPTHGQRRTGSEQIHGQQYLAQPQPEAASGQALQALARPQVPGTRSSEHVVGLYLNPPAARPWFSVWMRRARFRPSIAPGRAACAAEEGPLRNHDP